MPKVQETVLVEGRVTSFNLSPKGQIEGWFGEKGTALDRGTMERLLTNVITRDKAPLYVSRVTGSLTPEISRQ
jgi:hypothetical protein